jgi:aryl sulfotransferase
LGSLIQGGGPVEFRSRKVFAPIAASRADLEDVLDAPAGDLTDEEAEALRPRLYEAQARVATAPLFRKVHDTHGHTCAGEPLFPPEVTLGSVYIVRDPRDVAVSLAHHNGTSIDRAVTLMADPAATLSANVNSGKWQLRQRLSTWSLHADSWLNQGQALLLRYEDMLADPSNTLGRMARHLGLDAAPDAIRRAVAATSFARLRAAEDRDGFREGPITGARFFRRGVAGGWRDTLTPTQAERIVTDHHVVMARLDYL